MLAATQRFLIFLFLRKIANNAQYDRAFGAFHGPKHDIDREFASVFAATIKFESSTHGAHAGLPGVVGTVFQVHGAESLRNENLNRPAQKFRAAVPKEPFGVRIDFADYSFLVGHNNGVW